MSATSDNTTGKSGKRYRRGAEVRATAARMFAEKGYEATTSQDIGDAVGLLRGSIFYYFESKETLLFELIEEVWDGANGFLMEIIETDGEPVDKLRELLRRHILYLADHTVNASLFLHEVRSLSPEHRAVVKGREERYQRAVTKLIRDAQAAGTIRDDIDPKLAMFSLLGAANWTYRWYQPGRKLSATRVANQFSLTLVDGLLPTSR